MKTEASYIDHSHTTHEFNAVETNSRDQIISINNVTRTLTTETVEGTALALESVDNVERGDGLALGVLSVCDSITDDALEEGLEDTTGLFVDHWGHVRERSAR